MKEKSFQRSWHCLRKARKSAVNVRKFIEKQGNFALLAKNKVITLNSPLGTGILTI